MPVKFPGKPLLEFILGQMQTRFSDGRFALRLLFMLHIGLALLLTWVSHNYRIVQQRREYWPQFSDHDFSVRSAAVFKVEQSQLIAFPQPTVPWIRKWLGDRPASHLFYNPAADPKGSQLHRTRQLFPEAKIWTRDRQLELLPAGIERLTPKHYLVI